MLWTLAQMDPDEALAKGYWNLAMIVLVGLLAVVFFASMFLLRRWKHRELKAIDQRREARRAGQVGGRVDAWAASSERYIDHDKLPEDDEAFDHGSANEPDDDDDPIPGSTAENEPDEPEHPDDEDRDPYGLFADKPYQEPEDDDEDDEDEDFDEDDDDDWDDDEKP